MAILNSEFSAKAPLCEFGPGDRLIDFGNRKRFWLPFREPTAQEVAPYRLPSCKVCLRAFQTLLATLGRDRRAAYPNASRHRRSEITSPVRPERGALHPDPFGPSSPRLEPGFFDGLHSFPVQTPCLPFCSTGSQGSADRDLVARDDPWAQAGERIDPFTDVPGVVPAPSQDLAG